MEIPIVKAFIIGSDDELAFWCPFCNTFHYHQYEGHKTAHCSNYNSPFRKDGYIIKKIYQEGFERNGHKI